MSLGVLGIFVRLFCQGVSPERPNGCVFGASWGVFVRLYEKFSGVTWGVFVRLYENLGYLEASWSVFFVRESRLNVLTSLGVLGSFCASV